MDTNTFLWGLSAPEKLSLVARNTVAASERLLSVASIWEVLIKVRIGKLPLPIPAGEYLTAQMSANGVRVLSIKLNHVLQIEGLPMHHRDPFDRLLIAQSLEEGWPIVTSDPMFKKYPIRVIW
ncbi:MAG TPA: type II toxin-antitoxin system VapC family toxin [Terriglobales bacterium]|nr:type II toxin-antitoxin system VapC family toxin [Terriglobales bacterium]